MPDAYVHLHKSNNVMKRFKTNSLNNMICSCSPQLSVKATSHARKMRCVSGQMNAAAVTGTLEQAVTPVRNLFFNFKSTIISCVLFTLVFKAVVAALNTSCTAVFTEADGVR